MSKIYRDWSLELVMDVLDEADRVAKREFENSDRLRDILGVNDCFRDIFKSIGESFENGVPVIVESEEGTSDETIDHA